MLILPQPTRNMATHRLLGIDSWYFLSVLPHSPDPVLCSAFPLHTVTTIQEKSFALLHLGRDLTSLSQTIPATVSKVCCYTNQRHRAMQQPRVRITTEAAQKPLKAQLMHQHRSEQPELALAGSSQKYWLLPLYQKVVQLSFFSLLCDSQ